MKTNRCNATGTILCLLLAISTGAARAHTLTIVVRGAVPGQGQVIASLFSSQEHYLKQPLNTLTMAVDGNGGARVVFGPLDTGSYGVSVIYDQDNNNRLNTGFMGIPREPVGFSNNARSLFGPPSFDEVKFPLAADRRLVINLKQVR